MATADRLEYVLAGRDELTKPLRQAEGQMKRLGNQAQRTNKQMGAFSSNLANAQKGTRAFAMGSLQQAGYQVGDFAVQIANGTNKMQAFGQQAPQFLQIFGPIGSVVGAAVAVFAAAAVMIEKTKATAENLSKSVDKANTSIKNFSDSAANSRKSAAELAAEFGLMANEAKEFFEVQNEINRLVAFRDVSAAIDMATASFGEFGDRTVGALHNQGEAFDALNDKMVSLRKEGKASPFFDIERTLPRQLDAVEESLNQMADGAVVKLAKELGVSGSAAAFLAEEISKAQRAENLEDRVQGLVEVRRLYRDIALADGEISEEEQKRLGSLLEAQMSYLKIGSALNKIEQSSSKTSSKTAEYAQFIHRGRVQAVALSDKFKDMVDDTTKQRNLEEMRERALIRSNDAALGLRDALKAAADATLTADDQITILNAKIRAAQSGQSVAAAEAAAKMAQSFRGTDASIDQIAEAAANAGAKAEEVERLRQVFEELTKTTGKTNSNLKKTKENLIKLSPEAQRMADLGDSIGNSFEKAFMSIPEGAKSAKEAFRNMASEIIKELYRVFVVKQITGFISGFIADPAMFGGGKGPAGSSPRPVLRPKAIGGPVQAGGAYLVGERGPELFRPARSGSITPNDQLGGGGVVVNQTFNFAANGDDSVKQIIAQAAPTIAKMAQQGIIDARRRGGQVKQVFG